MPEQAINSLSVPKKRQLATLLALCSLLLFIGIGCSRDPNIRKQKFLAQGNEDFNKGKYSEALISYGRALQIDPRFADAHYKAAQCYLKQGSWLSAYRELLRTVDLQPENWPAQLDLGRILLSGGKPQDAKDRAVLILKNNPKNFEAQILLSQADLSLGDPKLALQEATEATNMAPDHSSAFLNLAMMQSRSGASADAETSLKKAQSTDPTSLLPLLTLGRFYQQQKRWPDAEKEYQAAIALAPKNPIPRAALAGLYFNQGQTDQAEKILTEAKVQLRMIRSALACLATTTCPAGSMKKRSRSLLFSRLNIRMTLRFKRLTSNC